LENNEKNVDEIQNEIKSLKKSLEEIQSDCPHLKYSVKYTLDLNIPKKICDKCNLAFGYATNQELKDHGFM
jgi:hypothetical protein